MTDRHGVRRIRLALISDDQDPARPAVMAFCHASVGTQQPADDQLDVASAGAGGDVR